MPMPKHRLTTGEPLPIYFAFDTSEAAKMKRALAGVDEETPSTQSHNLSDFRPGIDAAMTDHFSAEMVRFLIDKLSPEDLKEFFELGADDPDAEDKSIQLVNGHPELGRVPAADAALCKHSTAADGFRSRFGDRIGINTYGDQ
jgi:hypothetical protein